MKDAIQRSTFGVELMEPIDHYRMAARSVKYAAMFIVLTFAVVWLIDVLNVTPIHPVQYLLLGAALCCFYLLELSLAEHVGFGAAYFVASAAVFGMVTAYSFAILRRAAPASTVGGGVAALYGYLYIVLTNEDYALLIGSIGLFVILGAAMLLTRHIDWYASSRPSGAPAP